RGIKLQRIQARNSHLRAGNRNLRLGKDAIRFASTETRLCLADADLISVLVCIIRVKVKLFPTPVSTEGESNRTSRHVKQVGRISVTIDRCQRRLRQVSDLCTSKQDRWNIVRIRRLRETGKRIIRNGRPDKLRRIWIKNRVVRIHDAIKTRS